MLNRTSPVVILSAGLLSVFAPRVGAQSPSGAGAGAAAGAFTIDDAIDLTRVSDPQLSPDGTRLVFTRTELNWKENEHVSRLWIVNADGTDARPFTAEEGDSRPRWSPDGRWLAFIRSTGGEEKTRQIFLLRADGGEARQLTEHPTSVGDYAWSPDSRRIIFVADDTLSTAEEKARKDGADAVFVGEPPNGQGRGTWSNLWWVAADPDSGKAHPITEGERMIGDFAISPDGRRIAFTYRTENARNDQFRSEIAVVRVPEGPDAGPAPVRRLTENEAPESNLAWAPDGRTLTFMAPDLESWKLDQGNLYALELGPDGARAAEASIRQLAPDFAGEIRDYAWAPDGRSIHIVALERTVANLYRLDVGTGEVRQVSRFEGMIGSPSYSRDHARVAFTASTPTEPGDIYVSSTASFAPTRVTEANPWIADRTLAAPELVRWKSEDGLEIEGLLYLPPGGRTEPGAFVLEIHGGPAGVFTRGFDADAQVLAAHGYAVLQPNVRGSSGYGDDLLRGNMRDIGGGDYHDLMTGVDAMIRRGIAHPDSLAVKGWSYGGILGGWTITHTDRFKAASLGAMVSDWRSEFGPGFNYDVTRWYLGGDPWSNADFWLERSSYTYLDRAKTPTILFHGDQDRTDTIGQSFNFFAGLRRHGVPVRFIRFPREGHGIREPRHARTRLVEELRWFQKWVRGDADWEAPARPDANTTDVAVR
ncbi:MAG TPA: S9 family peptidase [Longimicrobiales bacterium]